MRTLSPANRTYFALIILIFFSACSDAGKEILPSIPKTYNFENVDYSGQKARILMLDSLERKIKEANQGTSISAAELKAIFENSAGDLFGSSKNIASKTHESSRAEIYAYFEKAEIASKNSQNLIENRLFDENGHEIAQMVAKGLMGSLLYYQSTSVYLSADKLNVDNLTVNPGSGTAMQHHWDEAFGYFGASPDFLTNENTSSSYWATYAKNRSEILDLRADIYRAFVAGRAAIGQQNYAERDRQAAVIKEKWELLAAANTVHYLNSTLADLETANTASLWHHWSEAYAFAGTLFYNADKKITNDQLTELKNLIGDRPDDISTENLQNANKLLQQIYGFSNAELLNL